MTTHTASSPRSPSHPSVSPTQSASFQQSTPATQSRRSVRLAPQFNTDGDDSSSEEESSNIADPSSIEGILPHSRHPSLQGQVNSSSPSSRLSSIVGPDAYVNKSSSTFKPTAALSRPTSSPVATNIRRAGNPGASREGASPSLSGPSGPPPKLNSALVRRPSATRHGLSLADRASSELQSDEDNEAEDLPTRSVIGQHLRPPNRKNVDSTESKERVEWRSMLSSVLSGDVLRGESSRIGVDKPGDVLFKKRLGQSLWWQIRARMRGRSEPEEKRRVEERRGRVVDSVLEEIEGFTIRCASIIDGTSNANGSDADRPPGETPSSRPADQEVLDQVALMLEKLALVEGLYPHQAAFRIAKQLYDSPSVQTRIHALTAWFTIVSSLQAQLAVLQRWTGTDDLDILRPNTTKEKALVGRNRYHPLDNKARTQAGNSDDQALDDSTFLDRVNKESIKKTFERRVFSDLIAVIHAAKATAIAYQPVFDEMQLPDFRTVTLRLIAFPSRLIMESIKDRLAKNVNVNDNTSLTTIIELLDGFRITLSLAVLIKRQYEEILAADPEGHWNIPHCLPSEYDQTLLDGVRAFFYVLHLRLKDGDKAIYFRETEILENEWEFLAEVAEGVEGGDLVVAEQFCALTNKLLVRVGKTFQRQMQASPQEISGVHQRGDQSDFHQQQIAHFVKMLDIARMRYRKLQRFARRLTQKFDNSAEYSFNDDDLDLLIDRLRESGHFLIYTSIFEESGTYIVGSEHLWNDPLAVRRLIQRAFSSGVMSLQYSGKTSGSPLPQQEAIDAEGRFDLAGDHDKDDEDSIDLVPYLLLLSPRQNFAWTGGVMTLDLDLIDFAVPDNRVRLIADGPAARLTLCKRVFQETWSDGENEEGELDLALQCVVEQQAHLPRVQRELLRIGRSTYRLSEAFIQSASHVYSSVKGAPGNQDLVENWYLFASDHGRRVTSLIDPALVERFSRLLMRLAISWVKFISDACDAADRRTFRWTVQALDYALNVTGNGNILYLDAGEFALLRKSVAVLVSLLISHFDILGARSGIEAKKEAEKLASLRRQQKAVENVDDDFIPRTPSPSGQGQTRPTFDRSIKVVREARLKLIAELEERRIGLNNDQHLIGQVLDEQVSEDRALVFLAASASNIAIRWRQGGFIGGGANGSVYIGINSDNDSVMAVKEIRVQDLNNSPALYKQIKDESDVMSMLNHENIVEYYGIEVHRDRVYIFEEYCSGGSLGKMLEHGRIEDEDITRVYASEILSGLEYLHSQGVEHRDIKPDNILLTDTAHLKLVDFGAAKVIAKGNKTVARTRAARQTRTTAADPLAAVNSLAGTPMYMAPEVIRNEKRGRLGSSDVWSMGCVVLEIATGRKPWSNLDNEWAIMFHIGISTQAPPLPDADQMSELGIDFVERCLTLDATERPTANELRQHPWIQLLSEQNWNEEEYYDETESYELEESETPAVDQIS